MENFTPKRASRSPSRKSSSNKDTHTPKDAHTTPSSGDDRPIYFSSHPDKSPDYVPKFRAVTYDADRLSQTFGHLETPLRYQLSNGENSPYYNGPATHTHPYYNTTENSVNTVTFGTIPLNHHDRLLQTEPHPKRTASLAYDVSPAPRKHLLWSDGKIPRQSRDWDSETENSSGGLKPSVYEELLYVEKFFGGAKDCHGFSTSTGSSNHSHGTYSSHDKRDSSGLAQHSSASSTESFGVRKSALEEVITTADGLLAAVDEAESVWRSTDSILEQTQSSLARAEKKRKQNKATSLSSLQLHREPQVPGRGVHLTTPQLHEHDRQYSLLSALALNRAAAPDAEPGSPEELTLAAISVFPETYENSEIGEALANAFRTSSASKLSASHSAPLAVTASPTKTQLAEHVCFFFLFFSSKRTNECEN